MKWLMLLFYSALAKETISPIDLAQARGTGVENVQFVIEAEDEVVVGSVDKAALRKVFASNMIGPYKCYSSAFGGSSRKTGSIKVSFELAGRELDRREKGIPASELKVESQDLTSKVFFDCLKDWWSRIDMPSPAAGTISRVEMPLKVRLRK